MNRFVFQLDFKNSFNNVGPYRKFKTYFDIVLILVLYVQLRKLCWIVVNYLMKNPIKHYWRARLEKHKKVEMPPKKKQRFLSLRGQERAIQDIIENISDDEETRFDNGV